MDFVAPSLAVGSLADAQNVAYCRANGIGAVLSLLQSDFDAGEHHATIPLRDGEPLPPSAVACATAFVARQLQAGRKVLVHCQMGLSRSPAIIAAYLHEYAGMSLGDALAWVRTRRTAAAPHPVLVDSLYRLYDPAAEQAPPEMLDLSANENPLGPSPRAMAALVAAAGNCHRYPDRHGRALRLALADQLGFAPSQLILGNGSCELLDLIARAMLAPGDQALIATPSFLPYQSAIERAHGEVVAVPLRADYHCDLAGMAQRIGSRSRLVILGHPNNPTGCALGAEELAHFLDALPEQVVVLIDEAYRDYVTRPDAADAMALVQQGRNVVALRTFSKVHALAGLRIGYAAARPDLAARIEAIRPHYNTNHAAQAAALACLGDHAHVADSLAVNRSGLAALASGCAELGLAYVASQANFLLVETGDADGIAAALLSRGVRVKSGAPFGLPQHIRISVGTPACNGRCLQALQAVLADRQNNNPINTRQGAQAW
ncbi:MAG TPA: histidinol-phosphate transaminase [Rhodocyclaceae bacterium]